MSWLRFCIGVLLLTPYAASARGQAPIEFEVATVKPANPAAADAVFQVSGRRITLHRQSVVRLLMYAYDVNEARIEGAPAWCAAEYFDIDGTLETGTAESREQVQKIVQALLAERFALKLHHVQRPMPVFVLQAADGGAKLVPSPDSTVKADQKGSPSNMSFTGMSMEQFAAALKYAVRKPVVDETGLKGRYDLTLHWTPDGQSTEDPAAPPPLPTALREQLGLKLKADRRPADVIVVDSVRRPSAN